ncbi:spinster family MFS transporter [Steroidobacter flavus]|uniref:Spinster family MFS transporter n=1 Tax=Steroidobacter flavus TaxID=1842136 RepID=A0ABV8SW67_9GAMM
MSAVEEISSRPGLPAAAQAADRTPEHPWQLFSSRQRWTMLAVLFLVSTVSNVDRQIMTVAIEPIKAEFHATDTQMGLLTGIAFALFYATLGLPIARWADRGNRKLIITISITFWSIMTAICGTVQNFAQMFFARLAVGGGEAGALPTSQSLIADYFPPELRGRAIGIFAMAGVAGYAAALIGGAQIASRFGWRVMFVTFGLSSLLIAVVASLGLREPRHMLSRRADPAAGERLGPSIAALIGKPSFLWQIWGGVFFGIVSYGALIFVVSHLVRSFQLPLAQAGTIYGSISTVTAIVGALAGGYLTDRLGRRSPAAVPSLTGWLMIAALPFFLIAMLSHDLTLFVVCALIGGCLVFGAGPSLFAGIHIVCGSPRRATAIALLYFMMNSIGLGGGPALTGLLSDTFGAHEGSAMGLRIAMLISFTALLPGGVCFLLAGRTMKADAER